MADSVQVVYTIHDDADETQTRPPLVATVDVGGYGLLIQVGLKGGPADLGTVVLDFHAGKLQVAHHPPGSDEVDWNRVLVADVYAAAGEHTKKEMPDGVE